MILAVHNQARYLPLLLSSLERQDCPVPFELLVCDDGSTDETAARVRACTTLDVRHLWQPNRGFRVSRSRNNGIRCAQGDLLVFCDGDSVLRPFFLRDHWEAHQAASGQLVCGCCQNVATAARDLPSNAAAYLAALPEPSSTPDCEERAAWLETGRPWMACTSGNMSIERTRALTFDERFQGWGSEDRDFAYRAHAAGLRIALLKGFGLGHVWTTSQPVEWNPTKGGDPESLVSALRSKLLLYRKYPGDLMAPSLDFVRYCRYDPGSDTWQVGGPQYDVSVADVLDQFDAWLASREKASHAPDPSDRT